MLRVLYHLHKFPPYHNAGAELMAYAILRWLQDRGHYVEVLSRDECAEEWGGIPIHRRGPYRWAVRSYRTFDVVLTHLDETPHAVALAHETGRPLVHVVHNDRQLDYHDVGPEDAALVVYNSEWIASSSSHPAPGIVVRPPVFADHYRVDRDLGAGAVTLINLTEAKGAPLFYRLASADGSRDYLGVTGAYGHQIGPPRDLSNLRILRNRPDVASVYAQTRVLLMPSSYESFGRVGIEAAASGIPTIAHPTPGLEESLGAGGIFAPRDDPDSWARELDRLDDPDVYLEASAYALERSAYWDRIADVELAELERRLLEVAEW